MDELSKITEKFEDDMRLLGDLFGNLKKTVVDTCISPISNFLDFLTANSSLLPMAVQSMKENYGVAIKWSTIELLITLRNDHFSKHERSDLLRSCEDIYKNTQKKAEKAKNFNVFKHLDQNFDAGTAASSTQGLDSKMASFVEEEEISEKNSSVQGDTKKSAAALNLEGYLDVEKDEFLSNVTGTLLSNLKYETKYFNLKRDILYFYKDKNSEFSQGSYKLKEMSAFGKTENEDCGFYMTVKTKDGETKTVRFKAATPEKRDVWLDFIKEAGGLPDYGGMIELNTDIQLYKDSRPLFADIEEMPNLEFTFTTNPNATNAGERNNRRKKSFHLDEPIPKQVDETEDNSQAEVKPKETRVEEEKNCLTCAMF